MKKLVLGSDHAGIKLKKYIQAYVLGKYKQI